MSGHSKWAQIKHKKAASDVKRGKLFSRLSRTVTIAAKAAGPDPKTNSKLAQAITEAKEANMPQDNIERAIKKVADKESGDLKEVTYEAYGPGGSALIITAVTDNSNRTTNEIKHILTLHDSKLGVEGSAMWAFDLAESPLDTQTDKKNFAPKFSIDLSDADEKKFEALLQALDDQDDVAEVYSNANFKEDGEE
jgi:YebC/PmpR family DNA-binding regulatory protein